MSAAPASSKRSEEKADLMEASEIHATRGEGPAAQHWRMLVERRRAQMDAAYAKLNRTSGDYWQKRMGRSSLLRRQPGDGDPLLQMLLARVDDQTEILDVGAGAGRYTRAVAPHVAQVTAVEPDATMSRLLEEGLRDDGLTNVRLIRAGWMDAEVEPAGIALCAHVLYPIASAVPFLRKLDASALFTCFLALRETTAEPEPLAGLWQHYHHAPRYLQPGFIEAYNLLHEMGIYANVRIVPGVRSMWTFDNIEHAMEAVREHLILPATPEVDAHLQAMLEQHLIPDGDQLTLPHTPAPSAILWWGRD